MNYIEQEDYRQAIERYLIKLERKKLNITLEELSKKIGKTKQYLSEIETGKKYNQKVIQILFSSLNIHFNFDYSEAFQIINDFNDFVHFYISMNKKKDLKRKIFFYKKNINIHISILFISLLSLLIIV